MILARLGKVFPISPLEMVSLGSAYQRDQAENWNSAQGNPMLELIATESENLTSLT